MMQEVTQVGSQQEQETAGNQSSEVARPRSAMETADLGGVELGSLERIEVHSQKQVNQTWLLTSWIQKWSYLK